MKIIIHRGTHQVGGVATEIRTDNSRIIIDMGDELSNDPDFVPAPLKIPGVSDNTDRCDAVLFTHYHGDHVGQLCSVRDGIPIHMGALAKEILALSDRKSTPSQLARIHDANTFKPGEAFTIRDVQITPFGIDHSACDSYMFLIEAEGKRILHTGDFRTHGFRGKAVPKILDKLVRKVDVLITEGTTLSRSPAKQISERDLQQKMNEYIAKYKYVFVLCTTTNLERIFAIAHTVPCGKYFICDDYQRKLLDVVERHWSGYSSLYKMPKVTVYGDNLLPRFQERGAVMMVRANSKFTDIIRKFDPEQGIILYSMWDGYRTKQDSNIPGFLSLAGTWETLHTSGHASPDDIKMLVEKTSPDIIVPMHTDRPEALKSLCPGKNVVLLQDGEALCV
jgi:ribonuclease J